MPLSPRTLRPSSSRVHADASAWRASVVANGGSVSGATLSAVNRFCKAITSAGIRDRFYRLNLFCGTGLNACLVPLYRGPSLSGTQYGNATDTNVGPFVSGDYVEGIGLSTTAGGGKYLNTGLTPNDMALSDVQAMHLAFSHGPIPSADLDPRPLGAHGATDRFSFVLTVRAASAGILGLVIGKTNQLNSSNMPSGAQASASWVGSRTSATAMSIYKNGAVDSSLATSVTGIAPHAFPFFVGRVNNSGSPLGDGANVPYRHYSIGAAMSASQVAAYETALSNFRTSLGRTA